VNPRRIVLFFAFIPAIILFGSVQSSSAQEIVLYASQAPVRVGNWSSVGDSTAAGGARLANPDAGLPKLLVPAAAPSTYFELTFSAVAGIPYRIWIRGKAQDDSPYNDSIYIQFSGSVDSAGTAMYRIGTTSATTINLEDCFACGLQNWGWQDNGWGAGVLGPEIYFQTSGTQTIRIQPREDGLSIDQIVLSPNTYRFSSPGQLMNDSVILPASSTGPAPTPTPTPGPVTASNVVIWASDVPSSNVHGSWTKETNNSAAGQVALRHPDQGAAKLLAPLASPTNYFDVNFPAVAGQPYRLWIRGRADGDYWGNDSVYAQFSGSLDSSGTSNYRIGTTDGLVVNLEDCSGCGLQGWGWQDDGWGIGVYGPLIYFSTTGTQTLRIQTREDGFSIDQIVLSPTTYLNSSPGALTNDGVILSSTLKTGGNNPPAVSISASPTSGTSPLFVSFSSTATDSDGYITNYYWNFGDGGTSTGATPTRTYQSTGSYTATLTVVDNAGATATASVLINIGSSPSTLLRVLSMNTAFGEGTDGIYDYNRTASWIAKFDPDLAALCEVPPYNISDLVTRLNQITGRTWYYYFVPKFPDCPEGNLILSKFPIVSTGSLYMSYSRSVARVMVNVGGRNINFFATHLDDGSSTGRYTEVGELMNWASGFSDPKIIAGDFNAGPDQAEIGLMVGSYFDSWNEAMNAGTAVAYPDNPVAWMTRTRRGRIDYVFYSRGATNLVLKNTQIPDSRDLNNTNVVVWLGTADDKGVRPSDHNQMIANFEVR